MVLGVDPADFLPADQHGRPFPQVHAVLARPGRGTVSPSSLDRRFAVSVRDAADASRQVIWRTPRPRSTSTAVWPFAAGAGEDKQPTEIVLSNSSYSGKRVRININRHFLGRALGFGICPICVSTASTAMAVLGAG